MLTIMANCNLYSFVQANLKRNAFLVRYMQKGLVGLNGKHAVY